MSTLMDFRIIPRARLYEITVEDMSYDHELIVVQTEKGSISVRIELS
jgi:hypothetical protein